MASLNVSSKDEKAAEKAVNKAVKEGEKSGLNKEDILHSAKTACENSFKKFDDKISDQMVAEAGYGIEKFVKSKALSRKRRTPLGAPGASDGKRPGLIERIAASHSRKRRSPLGGRGANDGSRGTFMQRIMEDLSN